MNKEANKPKKIIIEILNPISRNKVIKAKISPNEKKLIKVIKTEVQAFNEARYFADKYEAEEYAEKFMQENSDVVCDYDIYYNGHNWDYPLGVYFVFDFPKDFFKKYEKYVELIFNKQGD